MKESQSPTNDDVEPVLSIDDPVVRSIIASIISESFAERLLAYAERCLNWRRRATAVEGADLVQGAVALLLAGRVGRSISTDEVLRSLLATIRNLSRNVRKHERLADPDSRTLDHLASPLDSTDSAFRILLDSDIQLALMQMPSERRAAVQACLLGETRAADYARVRGIAASTVRNHLLRGRNQLRDALSAYRFDAKARSWLSRKREP